MTIPPELVAILRAHIERFGVSPTGHPFRSEGDKPVSDSTYLLAFATTGDKRPPPVASAAYFDREA